MKPVHLEIAELMLEGVPAVMRKLRRELRESAQAELTVPQLRILAHVRRGTDTAAELAELQGVSPAAISKMLDGLVERDLVKRTYKDGNRKQIFIRLTPSGEALYLKTRSAARQKIAAQLTSASAKEMESLRGGLLALLEFARPAQKSKDL